jgi:uncharacterized membrane protein YjjB (DUF3815 family)
MVNFEKLPVQVGALIGLLIGLVSGMLFMDSAFGSFAFIWGAIFGGVIGEAWSRWRQR